MRPAVIIVDDFYPNPDEIRQYALRQDFAQCDHCPGNKSQPTHQIDQEFYSVFAPEILQILSLDNDHQVWSQFVEIPCYHSDPGSALNQPWIHQDQHPWSFVIYLTPDFDSDSGTKFYRHRPGPDFDLAQSYDTKKRFFAHHDSTGYESNWIEHESHFDLVLDVPNVYNRLVLFPGSAWHRGGSSYHSNGFDRLTQTGGIFKVAQKP